MSANPVLVYRRIESKSRLPSVSLIRIQCDCSFCFQFRSLLHLSKLIHADRLGILGCSKFHVWAGVLCWLTGNYYQSDEQNTRILARLIWRPILLPDMCLLGFGSNKQLLFFGKICNFIPGHRVLLTIRCMDQIGGDIALQTKNLSSLRNHQWAITCSIGVQLFCIWWVLHPKKCNIYAKVCNECDPWFK